MKKLILLFVIATTLFSCSSNEDNIPNSDLTLQKVVFYRNSVNERHWNITNDLLTTITLSDGTVVEEFTYDDLNRVIKDTKYANGVVSEINTIIYNTDSTIASIDGLPYTYNASTRTYLYSYGSNFTINCKVNEDMLAVDFVRTGFDPGEYHMTYADGDMTSFKKVTNGSTDLLKNFHFAVGFGDNPIYNAVLAVAKVKSLTDPSFFIDSQASQNMADGFDKGASDTFYYNYGWIPSHNLDEIGVEVLDSNNNPIEFYSFADYHYQ